MTLRAGGGLVLAQDPAEARFATLPEAIIHAHAADAVLPVAAMPGALLAHADRISAAAGDPLPAIMALLAEETTFSPNLHRPATPRRRIQARMAALGLDRERYVARLMAGQEERAWLARDIMVHVGAHFRDSSALRIMVGGALQTLIARHPQGQVLRAWIPACRTGEETWTLAILLRQAVRAAGRSLPLQLIASDPDPAALAVARAALYPPSSVENVPAERLALWFEREAEGWRVRPELRATVIFAAHDARAQPPFADLDVIVAEPLVREVAMGERPALRARLAAGLRPGGLLLAPGVEEEATPPAAPSAGPAGLELLAQAAGLWRRTTAPMAAVTDDPGAAAALEREALYAELASRAAEHRAALDLAREARSELRNLTAALGAHALCLDPWLQLRFATPAARAAFAIGPQDAGQPLDRLVGLPHDPGLAADAARVMREGGVAEAHVRAEAGGVFLRRVLPYLAEDGTADGVVLGYSDISARMAADASLEAARAEAEAARTARGRFLGVAEQDLRDTLRVMQGQHLALSRAVHDPEAGRLLRRQGATLAGLSGLLNRLLDGATAHAAMLAPEPETVPLEGILRRLQAGLGEPDPGVDLRIMPLSRAIRTDRVLFERLLTGLLGRAIGAVQKEGAGRLLLGCRVRGRLVRIELWGRLPKASRGTTRGMGALREVEARREIEKLRGIATQLDHLLQIEVTPPQRGPWFTLEVPLAPWRARAPAPPRRAGRIFVLEPDAGTRGELLRQLAADGHMVTGGGGLAHALARLAQDAQAPELVLAGPSIEAGEAMALACALEPRFGVIPPVLALDCAAAPAPAAAQGGGLVRLPWSAGPQAIAPLVGRLLDAAAHPPGGSVEGAPPRAGLVHLIHAEPMARGDLVHLLELDGLTVEAHASAEAFLANYRPTPQACLVLDMDLPGMGALGLLAALRALGDALPVLALTGLGDVQEAAQALRAGASDVLEAPVRSSALLAAVARLRQGAAGEAGAAEGAANEAATRIARLTPRQRDIMSRVLAGQPSKTIAADLGISRRTVETHRAAIMRQTGAKSLPALARLALAASRGAAPG